MIFSLYIFWVFLEEVFISVRSIQMAEMSENQNETLYVTVCFGNSKVSNGDESVLYGHL